MPTPAVAPELLPDSAALTELQRLYDLARFRDAWSLASAFAPAETWPGVKAGVLAGRLLGNWGAIALADRVHLRNHRRHPDSLEAFLFGAYSVWRRHGPYEALRFLRARPAERGDDGQPPRDRAHRLSLESALLADFRDFARAEAHWRAIVELAPDDAWTRVERSVVLEKQDRYEEALAAVREALELRPWHRSAVERAAFLLQLLGRDAEAVDLLSEAHARLQAMSVTGAFARLLIELGEHQRAQAAFSDVESLLPRMDERHRDWVAGVRADLAYKLGDLAGAREAAARSSYFFQKHMAERLAQPPEKPRRVQLPVAFVRQHHMTCAPATLAALGRFWNVAVDHAALAAAITYDGTPHHEERHWAESNGWRVREFRLTWESAVALIDRGAPFTLTTVYTRSAHLQAVIGYDATLGTLIIRDPTERLQGEFIADKFLAAAAPHGPRAMALVPCEQARLLDGLELPDAELYDHYHHFRRALVAHDRDAAAGALGALTAAAGPDHLLALSAARELSSYDGTPARSLEMTEKLLARFPDDANYRLDRLDLLDRLGRVAERRKAIETYASHRDADPQFQRELAQLLAQEPRRLPRAHACARVALSRRGADATAMRTLADVAWNQRDFPAAEEFYRLAACAADKTEDYWRSYFIACRHTGRVEECLAVLRERQERLGARSPYPARTLFHALDALDRDREALALLAQTIERHPDDGDLRLFAAHQHARLGQHAAARELLEQARARSRPHAWQRGAAQIAAFAAEHAQALAHWRGVLAADPFDVDAQAAAARLTAVNHGRAAAIAHVREQIAQHPHFLPLRRELAEWMRGEDHAARLQAVEDLLALEPRDAWGWREKALALQAAGRPVDAFLAAERALVEEPDHPSSHSVKGEVLLAMGRTAEARAAFEAGLQLDLNADWIVSRLLDACRANEERRAALDRLRDEMRRQPSWGDLVLTVRIEARSVFEPDEIRRWLEELHAQRPEHWQVAVALIAHLYENNAVDAALPLALRAAERFATIPRLWLELANCRARLGQVDEEIAALQHALVLNPTWAYMHRRLGIALEKQLKLADAAHAYRRGCAADPLDALLRGHLADVLSKLGEREAAAAELAHAVQLDPAYSWAWKRMHQIHAALGRPEAAIAAARSAAEARAGEARGWIELANLLQETGQLEEALQQIERALSVEPRHHEAHDQRAQLLTRLHRFDDALAACAPPIFGAAPPFLLRGRAAWVHHERGDTDQAIKIMRATLQEHPDYFWGWQTLAEWLHDQGEHEESVRAAQQLVRLNPAGASSWGFLAMAQIELKRLDAAKQSLREALKLEPDYLWAANRLFDLHLDDREFDDAEKLLPLLRAHASPASHARAQVQLAARRHQLVAAQAALESLLTVAEEETYFLRTAVEAMFAANWRDVVEPQLRAALGRADAAGEVGRLWVRSWYGRGLSWRIHRLRRARASAAVTGAAWRELLDSVGRSDRRWFAVFLRWTRQKTLRSTADLWGMMGYALVTCGWRRLAAAWLHDWRARPGLEAWMLYNLTLALVLLGRLREARAPIERGLELSGADPIQLSFAVFQAYVRAQLGDPAAARRALDAAAHPRGLGPVELFLRACARTSVEVMEAAEADRPRVFRERIAEVKAALADVRGKSDLKYCTRAMQRTLRQVAPRARAYGHALLGCLPGLRWYFRAQRTESTARILFLAILAVVILRAIVSVLGAR